MVNQGHPAESRSVQDFLKAVYLLRQSMTQVPTTALAQSLFITLPAVTHMARRLSVAGLVDYERYYGITLTQDGEHLAYKVLRNHCLVELYLVEKLGYTRQEVHAEAENLEHFLSEKLIQALVERLNHPDIDIRSEIPAMRANN